MRSRLLAITLLAAAPLGSCVEFDSYSEVTDLRVLAIRADPPELLDSDLPEDIRFTALVVDPTSDDPIELNWEFCPLESDKACADYDDLLEDAVADREDVTTGLGFEAVDLPELFPFECLSPESVAGFGSLAAALVELSCTPKPAGSQEDPPLTACLTADGEWSEVPYLSERFRGSVTGDTFTLTTVDYAFGATEPEVRDRPLRNIDLEFFTPLAADLRACDSTLVPDDFDPSALPSDMSDLHLFHFFSDPLGTMLGKWPSVTLTAVSGSDELEAIKRLNLTFRDPSSPLAMFGLFAPDLELGIDFCEAGESTTSGCIRVRERQQNANPVFSDIRVSEGDDARVRAVSIQEPRRLSPDGAPLPATYEVIEVQVEESVRILPVFTDESYQSYQAATINLETLALDLADSEEVISVSWFVTDGSVADDLTYPLVTKTLDTAYTAPDTVPEETGGQVRMWLVARDQRGGTAWQELDIRILP